MPSIYFSMYCTSTLKPIYVPISILIILTSKIKMPHHVKISAQPLLEDNGKMRSRFTLNHRSIIIYTVNSTPKKLRHEKINPICEK